MSRARWLAAGLLVACCLVAGCGGDEGAGEAAGTSTVPTSSATSTTGGPSSSAEATTTGFSGGLIEARVTGGKVETASRRVEVDRGQKVRIRVQSDRSEEVPMHGYDLSRPVGPGQPAVIEFTADAPGVFEVELEGAKLRLFELRVQ
jgi:hypothetical protein